MADDDKKEMKMEFHPEFLTDLEKLSRDDPEAASEVRELLANMRQAMEGVKSGKYVTFDEGMETITGQRPQIVSDDDDDDEESEEDDLITPEK